MPGPRVILVSLDAFVTRNLRPEVTPNLWRMAQAGGYAPGGGVCDLPSVTYPSHATMLSGRRVGNHGVRTGRAGAPIPGAIPGWAGATHVSAPTLFDACEAAGLRAAAVVGDQKLVGILNAGMASSCWPPTPDVPPGVATDAFGYATNEAIHERATLAVGDPANRFVFVHENETDTVSHLFGPDSEEALACCAATDALVGQLLDAAGDPAELVFLVVSDHGMELLPEGTPIDPTTVEPLAPFVADSIDEAGASLVRLRDGASAAEAGAAALRVPGVAAWTELAPGVLVLEAVDGVLFGRGNPAKAIRASHGGRSTARTLAVVAGGHPAVSRIAAAIGAAPPHLADWAPTIASVLGITLPPGIDGRDLTA